VLRGWFRADRAMDMSCRQGSGWTRQQFTNSFLTSFFACRGKC
jgi:hypothetical protein